MDFPLPPVGEGLLEVELVRWLVKAGDAVKPGQGLMEVMSDKATMEVPAPFGGVIVAVRAEPGAKIKVGEIILSYSGSAATVEIPAAARPAYVETHPVVATKSVNGRTGTATFAAPSVRHLARKLGVDLAAVRGSGPAGRVLLDDLSGFLKPKPGAGGLAKPATTDISKLDFGAAGTVVKLAGLRKTIAERMVASKRAIPHYSYIDECDLSEVVRLRAQLREPLAATGVKLTYLAFFIKAVAKALKDVPMVNSTLNETTQEITLHKGCHVGLAVAAPNGLIVPVIKDADKKDLAGIAAEIERLSEAAKAGRPKLDDLRGGTFTVTSVGGIGGLISTPIINHPEAGIMGIGKVTKRPVYDARGKLVAADIVFLSFSFDHRIVDGAVGAAFGNAVLKHLAAPAVLLLPL